jgi:hypothetical protein
MRRQLALLAALLVTAGGAAAAEPNRVRFAAEIATAETRQHVDRYIEEAGLRRAPAARKPPSGPLPIEKIGGRQRVLLDGRFMQLTEVATISRNPDRLEGADVAGRILMYTPEPVEGGSSVSHWDRRAMPNLLMEPALGPGPNAPGLDVTPAVMQDIGWRLGTSQVVIVPADLPNLGLNDPRPFAGAPGNPATTLGAARRTVLEAAFATWAETLQSDVPIVALVRFDELFCERNVGAILAGAGPLSAWSELDNPAALAGTWYPAALAESLQGEDLTGPPTATGGGDITVVVNAFLDEGCLGEDRGWYYGLDNQAPATKSNLYSVLLHELAHGLGMLTFTNAFSGAELHGLPAIYDRFLYDPVVGKTWPELDDEGRLWSARRHGRLAWKGAHVLAAASGHLAPGSVELRVAGGSAAGEYPTVPATFGKLPETQLTAPLVCAQACGPLAVGSLAGRIALVERGTCAAEVKARNVQQAGAVGMILANLAGDTQVLERANGDASDITIPVVAVGRSAGARLETAACPDQAPPLAGGRFDVHAVWFTEREAGNAQITRLTANSVYATFFDPDNPELLIKVLDACSSPESRFWVFAAGLTNVGVELWITDTVTGLSRGYVNPAGHAFEPVLDTSAFACGAVP